MLAKVLTGAVVGLDGALVEVEVDIAPGGMPNCLVVGLPDITVQEARERVRAAIGNSGLRFPKRRRYRCCTLRPGSGGDPSIGRGCKRSLDWGLTFTSGCRRTVPV